MSRLNVCFMYISSSQCPLILEDMGSLGHQVLLGLLDFQGHKDLKVNLRKLEMIECFYSRANTVSVCVSHGDNAFAVLHNCSGDPGVPGISGSSRGRKSKIFFKKVFLIIYKVKCFFSNRQSLSIVAQHSLLWVLSILLFLLRRHLGQLRPSWSTRSSWPTRPPRLLFFFY